MVISPFEIPSPGILFHLDESKLIVAFTNLNSFHIHYDVRNQMIIILVAND